MSSDVIEEVRGKAEEFTEDPGCLYKFVTKPGPFNFVGDENSTPCKSKKWPRPVTPATALGKRKRRRKEVEEEVESMDYDGALFSNEYASTSCDEDSFNTVVTPLRGVCGPRGATVRNSGGVAGMREASERSNLSRGERESRVLGLLGNPGETKKTGLMLGESPLKRSRKDGGSISGYTSVHSGSAKEDTTILTKVWKEITLNR